MFVGNAHWNFRPPFHSFIHRSDIIYLGKPSYWHGSTALRTSSHNQDRGERRVLTLSARRHQALLGVAAHGWEPQAEQHGFSSHNMPKIWSLLHFHKYMRTSASDCLTRGKATLTNSFSSAHSNYRFNIFKKYFMHSWQQAVWCLTLLEYPELLKKYILFISLSCSIKTI